jgi:carbamoyl-phosphate synthase large subunit
MKTCITQPTILLTGGGSPGIVGIIRYLKRWFKVVVVDADPNAVGFVVADNFEAIPSAESKDFIPRLLEICKKNCVRVVYPKCTAELPKLAKAKELFRKNGIEILISSELAIANANNKAKFLTKCQEHGIPTPKFFSSNQFCSNPQVSSGSKGFRLYEAQDQVVMEYLPGDEYSVDILCDKGKALTIIPRVREKVKAGVTMVGTTVPDKKIEELSRLIVEKFKLHGIVGLQFKRDADGEPRVFECNPRVQGTIMLSELSGGNILLNGFNIAVGSPIEEGERRIVTMRRYLEEIYE